MAEFWAEWGMLAYGAAAIWAFFEGETFVLIASAAGADAFGTMDGGRGFTWGVEPRIQTLFGDPTRTLRWQTWHPWLITRYSRPRSAPRVIVGA